MSHSLPVLFSFIFLLFFFKVTIAVMNQFRLLGQDQSAVAQQAETTVDKGSLMSCIHFIRNLVLIKKRKEKRPQQDFDRKQKWALSALLLVVRLVTAKHLCYLKMYFFCTKSVRLNW